MLTDNKKYLYIGLFFESDAIIEGVSSITRNPLEVSIKNLHVTFAYKPKLVDESLFGEPVTVFVTGYASDGANEALKVALVSDNPAVNSYINEVAVPHITLSRSSDGHSVNSRYLDFEPVQLEEGQEIKFTGIFGGFGFDGKVKF